MTASKITPAIAKWCRALRDPADCRLVRETYGPSEYQKSYLVEGPLREPKPTWAMVERLERAGLIEWKLRGPGRSLNVHGLPDRTTEHVAALTESGRAQAAVEMQVKVDRLALWPFPNSTTHHLDGTPKRPSASEPPSSHNRIGETK